MKAIRRFFRSAGPVNAASSLIAILVGLVFGGLILLISNPGQALQGLGIIVAGGFGGGMKGVGQTLYYATPLIMTGLSVGFAFKTGLFNIGASGQLITGGLAAIYVGVNWTWLPDPLHWVVALLAAMVVGGLWGAIPGILKAKLNVNEVIACIMCNYIGMYGVNYLIKNSPSIYDQLRNQTVSVDPAAAIPKWGLDQVFYNLKGNYHDVSSVNGGILLAILLAVLMYVLLNKTVFGYELKACGYNRHASKYAGINESRCILLSMAIAGALAGFGAGLFYLSNVSQWNPLNSTSLPGMGFNGISVALLASSNPIGTIFSALFISHISVGGTFLSTKYYPTEIADLISGIIIYLCAFSMLFRGKIQKLLFKNADKTNVNAEPAPAEKANAKKEGK